MVIEKIVTPLRVALWSPKGSGLHYGGPGMTAYRMYGSETATPFSLELCHGYAPQSGYELFQDQHLIHDCGHGRFSQYRFIQLGKEWLRENAKRFDVFHGLQGFQMTVEPAWTAEKLGIPSFVKIASHQADLAGSWVSRMSGIRMRRIKMLRELSGVIAISSEIEQECLECGVLPEKVRYIPNGVNVSHFRPLDKAKSQQELRHSLGLKDLPTITFAGSLVRRKRPHLLITALSALKRQGREIQLVLVGPKNDEPYFDQMQERIKDNGLEELVHFAGMQSDVRPYLHSADLFALPSNNEGLPNAVMEALACGIPSILTPMSGARDLVERYQSCGRICDADPNELATAIGELLDNSTLRKTLAVNARNTMEAKFSSNAVLNKTLELFLQHQ